MFLINGLIKVCKNTAIIYLKVGDESESNIHFWTILKG